MRHSALDHAVHCLEKQNARQFELYFERKSATRIESKDQQVETLSRSEDVGLAVRIIADQRLGFSFTTSLEPAAIERAVKSAVEVARYMPQDPFAGFHSFKSSKYQPLPGVAEGVHDTAGLAVPLAEKIARAKQLERLCREADHRIQGIRSASISEVDYEVQLVDSNGENLEHSASLFTASVTCKAGQDGDSQMGSDFGFSNHLSKLELGEVAKRAAESAVELLGAKNPDTFTCPAIFRNDVVAELIEFISGSFSAEEIDKGRSMLAGKQGQTLFSDRITLIDDGLLPGGYGSSPFDGEGVPTGKTVLVDSGTVKGALYDGYYARKVKTHSTGNSQRGIKAPPSIGFNNLYLKPGQNSFNSLLDGISKGILITNLMGVHTANSVTGDFSLGASGILIENGKLTRPVRGFAVAGNILGVFKKVTDVGSDLRFFGNTGAPSIRITELSVGGA